MMKMKKKTFLTFLIGIIMLCFVACPVEAENQQNTIDVTFTLIGDDVHGTEPHIAFYKWIANAHKQYMESDGKTVLDLIDDVLSDYDFKRLGSDSYISGIVTSDGVTLSEKMNGGTSGWMYSVNGTSPGYGVSGYVLKDGDNVQLYYVHSWNENLSEAVDVPVENVELDIVEKTMFVGETLALKAGVKPAYAANQNITWTSSDTSIATVDAQGNVIAQKEGVAVITAISDCNNDKMAQCMVTVKSIDVGKDSEAVKEDDKTENVTQSITENDATEKIKISESNRIRVKKLTLNRKKIVLKKGKKLTLKVKKSPVTATDKLWWSSSNKKIAAVNSKGTVRAKKKGTVVITVKASNGKKASCKVTVKN